MQKAAAFRAEQMKRSEASILPSQMIGSNRDWISYFNLRRFERELENDPKSFLFSYLALM